MATPINYSFHSYRKINYYIKQTYTSQELKGHILCITRLFINILGICQHQNEKPHAYHALNLKKNTNKNLDVVSCCLYSQFLGDRGSRIKNSGRYGLYSRLEARLGYMRPYLKRTKIDKKKMNSKRKQALTNKIYFTYLCF